MRSFRSLLVLAPLAACGCGASAPSTPRPPDAVLGPVTPQPASRPLAVGDPFPKLEAEGWINGEPPAFGAPGTKLFVVDLWAQWCPFCARSAPGLSELHTKFAPKGVAFVGLSNMKKDGAERFVREHKLAWPNGYGALSEHLAALGARSGMPGSAEYELAPTVYLVSPAGRVLWFDDRGRFAHEDPAAWARKVEAAVERALAAAEPNGAP
jgi:thiol-disulfide isomerase/thioredoxin